MSDLFDTSVWIEYLRGTESAACRHVERRLLTDPGTIVMTEVIGMELMAGPTDELALAKVAQLVDALTLVRLLPALDFPEAAALHRRARASGRTVRKLNDCLIAAVAIRADLTVVHRDSDFELIASVSDLRTHPLLET